ncbi:MAG: ABC transporter permease [Anaerolinea sp.]|nr:ABC transporter permease [Anaerolinea sp.]
MVIRPRWRKALADLLAYPVRSLLVVLSIAVGLFAIGLISTTYWVSSADMRAGYRLTNPANITLKVSAFDDELPKRIAHLDGVAQAEGLREFSLRVLDVRGQWVPINIKALPEPQQLNLPRPLRGTWPPPRHQIAIDQYKLDELGVDVGGEVVLELPSGQQRHLTVAAVVKDQTIGAAGLGGGFFVAPIQGYVAEQTSLWLGLPETNNTLLVTVEDGGLDLTTIEPIAQTVKQQVEDAGYIVYTSALTRSDDHPNAVYADAMGGVLFVLGALVVFLSGFLITNTLSALLTQQIQQIGAMKTVGAQRMQIVSIYMALILVYGLLALALALPLSNRAAFAMMEYLSNQINYDLLGYRLVPRTIVLQTLIALLAPQLAGLWPILRGTGVSVQQALSGMQTNAEAPTHLWSRGRLFAAIPRPLLLSLRNTFRQRMRVLLTLLTLSLGGAMFIATFNVRASIDAHIERLGKYFMADVNLDFDRPYRMDQVRSVLQDVPGVGYVEGWALALCEIVFPDGSTGENVHLIAPPSGSRLIEPVLIEGRWIAPGDVNAIALNENFRSRFPDLHIGDTIRLKLYGEESDWVVVGYFQMAGKSGGYLAYTDYDSLAHRIHSWGSASSFRVLSTDPNLTLAEQRAFSALLEQHLRAAGLRLSEARAGKALLENTSDGLNALTVFLQIMALLTALVGSIGLTGTMSLNVMERTREMGILRAIGASDRAIFRMVLVEGLLLGLSSWLIGALLAFPISRVLTDTISRAIFDAPMAISYVADGFLIWLGLVILLAMIASLLPARSAVRLTIREVLSYE